MDDKPMLGIVSINVDKREWEVFKDMVGERMASHQVRELIREFIKANRVLTSSSR